MPKVYDDWERLVRATIKREEIWQLCHDHSRTPSGGSTTTSGSSPGSSSPGPDPAPKRPTPRASPLTRQSGAESNRVVVPVSSSTHLTRLGGAESNHVVVPVSSSTKLSSLNPQNERGIKNDKSSMRTSKSRMRLDRWVWTRWLSNTFSTQKTDHA